MKKKTKNGYLPGWPPFSEFKREMADIVSYLFDEKINPIKNDTRTMKDSLLGLNNRITGIEKQLTNHVTDTDKKIDSMRSEVNKKLDQLLKRK